MAEHGGYVIVIVGNEKIVEGSELKRGGTKSCGCLRIEYLKESKKKYNIYDLAGKYGIGFTFKNEKFYFDLDDFEKIAEYCWYINNLGYLVTRINKKPQTFHRLIMDVLEDREKIIDHKNGVKYDNRKENLRICTPQENVLNSKKPKNNKSGIKGVCWDKKNSKWLSQIRINNKNIFLGLYTNIEEAAKMRKDAEIKLHGEFRYKEDD